MKRILALTMTIALMVLVASSVMARSVPTGTDRLFKTIEEPAAPRPALAARADTVFAFASSGPGAWGQPGTTLRGYNFDGVGQGEPAGWEGVDLTAQDGPTTRWHLASTVINAGTDTDMAAAGQPWTPGDAINDFACWCGLLEVCGWINPTGYGNQWDGSIEAAVDETEFTSSLTINFGFECDYEGEDYDYFELLLKVGEDWVEVWDEHSMGQDNPPYQNVSVTVLKSDYPGETDFGPVRFRFRSDTGWSDEDGNFVSNIGAAWIDNIELRRDANVLIRHEDFESGIVPAWIAFVDLQGAGDYAALYANLYSEDPCTLNPTYAWAFFDINTTEPEYPLPVIAYGGPNGPYVTNMARSPILDMVHEVGDPNGTPLELTAETQLFAFYWVYVDLPMDAVLYYQLSAAAQVAGQPCLNKMADDNGITYGDVKIWSIRSEEITQYVLDSAGGQPVTGVAVEVGVYDYCEYWCDTNGPGFPHVPGPFFDNIEVAIVQGSSIAWNYDYFRRLQDAFPGTPGGTARIESCMNVEQTDDPVVVRGDSTNVELIMDGAGGIKTTYNADAGEDRPELYLLFQVVDGPHAGMETDPVEGPLMADQDNLDGCYNPWTGIKVDPYGDQWGSMQADTSYYQGNPQTDRFAFDFNDDYFLAGDVIYYYFKAEAVDGTISCNPLYAETDLDDPILRQSQRWAVRVLPTSGNRMLFVEDSNNLNLWWREAFRYNGYTQYDRFYCQAPSSGLWNDLSGMTNIDGLATYNWIVWDSGSLENYSVTNQTNGDKTDDASLLLDFMTNQTRSTYLWMMGDAIANNLGNGEEFFVSTLGCNLVDNDSYQDNTGILSPRVNATHPLLQYGGQTPYFWAFGGCPFPLDFSMVASQGGLATVSHSWQVNPGLNAVAGVYNTDPDGNGNTNNSSGNPNRTLFMPLSYSDVRDGGFLISSHLDYGRYMVGQILNNMMSHANDSPPDAAPPAAYVTRLDGNFPNPFNPKTTIKFSLASAEHVTLSVYDISGRLVNTLINEPMSAGQYKADWSGTDFAGHKVASGVYFAKMNAGDYSATERMVMLK